MPPRVIEIPDELVEQAKRSRLAKQKLAALRRKQKDLELRQTQKSMRRAREQYFESVAVKFTTKELALKEQGWSAHGREAPRFRAVEVVQEEPKVSKWEDKEKIFNPAFFCRFITRTYGEKERFRPEYHNPAWRGYRLVDQEPNKVKRTLPGMCWPTHRPNIVKMTFEQLGSTRITTSRRAALCVVFGRRTPNT